jgi:choloylglycine hydrolase
MSSTTRAAPIVIEPVGGTLKIHDNPLGMVTNSPSFDWHMTNLPTTSRCVRSTWRRSNRQWAAPLGQGSGMVGMPGDFTPPSRFVRAAIWHDRRAFGNAEEGIKQTFHIRTISTFRSASLARRRASDRLRLHPVRWHATRRTCYWRTYDDQTIRMVDMRRWDWGAGQPSAVHRRSNSGVATATIVDMTGQLTAQK